MDNLIVHLVECNRAIKGFGGMGTGGVKIGTIKRKCLENSGKRNKFMIPKAYYATQEGASFLRSQHWAKSQRDENPIQRTGSSTDARNIKLYWDNIKYKLTIPLDEYTNFSNINVEPGYNKFQVYFQEAELGS